MPYEIVKDGDQHCVVKKDTGKRIPGGCHPTEAEAMRHMRAILANEHMSVVISIDEMRAICPKCAEVMEARGLVEMRFDEFAEHTFHSDKMERCKQHLLDKGFDQESAHRICYDVLGEEANVEKSGAEITYLLDNYVTTAPGEPYRLFPFGRIIKNGKERMITPELAKRFKLPHFKPPIKLGSHEEATPAGGHIIGLEVRDDGLYALPEVTEKGAKILDDGSYRYHSPEVIWEDGGLENPQTGELISGPLIVGDALLHTPHLGEATALYSIETIKKEETRIMENVNVPTPLWEKFIAWFSKRAEEPTPEPPEVPEEYTTAIKERDELKAQIERMEIEKAKQTRVDNFAAELDKTKIKDGAEILAGMTDEQADWVLEKLRALSTQVDDSALLGERGTTGEGLPEDPSAKLEAVIRAKMDQAKLGYVQAFEAVRKEQPDLFKY